MERNLFGSAGPENASGRELPEYHGGDDPAADEEAPVGAIGAPARAQAEGNTGSAESGLDERPGRRPGTLGRDPEPEVEGSTEEEALPVTAAIGALGAVAGAAVGTAATGTAICTVPSAHDPGRAEAAVSTAVQPTAEVARTEAAKEAGASAGGAAGTRAESAGSSGAAASPASAGSSEPLAVSAAVASAPAAAQAGQSATHTDGGDEAGGGDGPERGGPGVVGRVPRPMRIAAAFAGAALIATPFIVAGLQGGDDGQAARREQAAAWNGGKTKDGFVPGTDPQQRGDEAGSAPHTGQGGGGDQRGGTGSGDGGAGNGTRALSGVPAGSGVTGDHPAGQAKSEAGTGSGGESRTTTGGSPSSQPGGGSGGTKTSGSGASKGAAAQGPGTVFSAIAGPYCSGPQRFQMHDYVSDKRTGWSSSTGGYKGSGCDGRYVSMPMSGGSGDGANSVNWLFDTSADAKQCRISVYIPRSSDVMRVGGTATYYSVYRAFTPKSDNLVGSFSINQVAHQGGWYDVSGTFPVGTRKISVKMHDRGTNKKGSTKTYAHHAAAAVRVNCTG